MQEVDYTLEVFGVDRLVVPVRSARSRTMRVTRWQEYVVTGR